MPTNILQKSNTKNVHEGIMIVFSSPSGTGKSTIIKQILQNCDSITLSMSVTTRPQGSNEVHMRDYQFVTEEQFDELIKNDEILEYTYTFGHRYGTLKNVQLSLFKGRDIIFDIDWHGAKELKKLFPDRVVTIFIIPPDYDTLKSRIFKRNREKDDIQARLQHYFEDIKHFDRYDYIVMNDDLDLCVSQIICIIAAERQKTTRQRLLRQHLQNETCKS